MNRRSLITLVLLVGMSGSLSGCSLFLVRRPPSQPQVEEWPMCTENRVWPIVDAVSAAMMLSPLVYFAAFERDSETRTLALVVGIPLFGASAAGFGYSSFTGFGETARCAKLHREYEAPLELSGRLR